MAVVKPKKSLGQHFLTDMNIAMDIVEAMKAVDNKPVLEIGPGTGVLTQYLINNKEIDFSVIEIDRDSVAYLKNNFQGLKIFEEDFLDFDLNKVSENKISIIGNFPYNISSQIFFKILEDKESVDEVVCMLQHEVAARLASPPGSKQYGILSVLLQAYYDVEYLFKVPPTVFNPPPKVDSGVIRVVRNDVTDLGCDTKLFKRVIKTTFNQRRKMISNSIKTIVKDLPDDPIFKKRPEQLSVEQFIYLTNLVEKLLLELTD